MSTEYNKPSVTLLKLCLLMFYVSVKKWLLKTFISLEQGSYEMDTKKICWFFRVKGYFLLKLQLSLGKLCPVFKLFSQAPVDFYAIDVTPA